MIISEPNLDLLPAGLEVVSTALKECNDPLIQRDLTLSIYFLKAIIDTYEYFATHKNSLPSQNPGWRQWLENLEVTENSNFKTLYNMRMEPDNSERIKAAFDALVEANSKQLKGINSVINFNSHRLGTESQKDDVLQTLLEATQNIDFEKYLSFQGGLDILSNGFSFLLRYFAATYSKKTGDIIPPQKVTQLISKLLDPQINEEICDSTCSSGSMLVEYKHYDLNLAQYKVFGQEGNLNAWALAKMNLFLNGCDCSNIELGDSISEPKWKESPDKLKKFDVLVSNLLIIPGEWATEKAEADTFKRFRFGVPLKNKGEYGYIQHMIASMKTGTGRMAVIVPRGVLFRGGAEASIRQKLIEENLLATVISLPEKLFYGAIIPVAILILNAKQTEKHDVMFIDASRDFQPGKTRNTLRNIDIDRVVNTYKQGLEVPGYSYRASVAEIENNEYNLNMPRYVQTTDDDFKLDPDQIELERKHLWEDLARLYKAIDPLIHDIRMKSKLASPV